MAKSQSDLRVNELNNEIANLLRSHRRHEITITQLMGGYAGNLAAPKGSLEQRYAVARDDLLAAAHLDEQMIGRELSILIKERDSLQNGIKEAKREQDRREARYQELQKTKKQGSPEKER